MLFRSASPGGVVTLESLTKFRSARVDAQRKSNPYYFSGPFAGVLVQPAAYTFIFRFMANHSAENPEGILPFDVLQSWFGIQGTSGKYTAVQGGERIPNNWVSFVPLCGWRVYVLIGVFPLLVPSSDSVSI